jgi:hypothetical protein
MTFDLAYPDVRPWRLPFTAGTAMPRASLCGMYLSVVSEMEDPMPAA